METELYNSSLFSDANLVAYYRLENVNDSKSSYTLTNAGTTPFNAALFGNGADQGSSNTTKYLYRTDVLGFNTNGNNNITVVWRMKFNSLPASGTGMSTIFFALDPSSGSRYFYRPGYGNTAGVYTMSYRGITYTFSGTPSTTEYYYFAFTSTTGQVNKLYVNGELVGTTTQNDNATATNTPRFAIGASVFNAGSFDHSSCIYDDVAIFSRVLSQEEIQSLNIDIASGKFFQLL